MTKVEKAFFSKPRDAHNLVRYCLPVMWSCLNEKRTIHTSHAAHYHKLKKNVMPFVSVYVLMLGSENTFWESVSPSTMWVACVRLKLVGMAASDFTHWTISPAHSLTLLNKMHIYAHVLYAESTPGRFCKEPNVPWKKNQEYEGQWKGERGKDFSLLRVLQGFMPCIKVTIMSSTSESDKNTKTVPWRPRSTHGLPVLSNAVHTAFLCTLRHTHDLPVLINAAHAAFLCTLSL